MTAVLIDANLTILLAVGLTNREYIARHKRCKQFDEAAFDLLKEILAQASEVIVTPNSLSEASNLVRYIDEPAKSQIGRTFRTLVERSREIYIESASACAHQQFLTLGLTDTAILKAAHTEILIVSTDSDLCVAAEMDGQAAMNFNHVRDDAYNRERA